MAKNQKSYTPEFKQQIVDLYNSGGTSYPQLEREYGVNRSTISGWVKKLSPIRVLGGGTVTLKEYKALQKEIQRLCLEISKEYLLQSPGLCTFKPYDNTCIEPFHSVLKKEEIYLHTYQDTKEARRAIFEYIEGWYNRKRIHSAIGYMTPQQKEDEELKKAA